MHEGHRSRLKRKLVEGSLLYEHELMEILLFNAQPRKDVNAVAHSLVESFGGLLGAFRADEERLKEVEGVGENVALYLSCLGKILSGGSGCLSFAKIGNTEEFNDYLRMRYEDAKSDSFELFFVDKEGRIKRICTFNGDGATPAQIIKKIGVYNPYGVFAAFRRTGASALPTESDEELCSSVRNACTLCGKKMYDYCVVGDLGETYSFYLNDKLERGYGAVLGAEGDNYGRKR